MIFKRLFGRMSRGTPAPEAPDDLIRIVQSDGDTETRRHACRRIKRLADLRALVSSDLDASIRETALAHYGMLLCGQVEGGPDLTERLVEIAELEDRKILARVARGGDEGELRRATIAKISDPDVLCSCAVDDALTANRSAAIERLDDKHALERVLKNIGRKDKRIYRVARQKLKDIAEREALPERTRSQCRDLCEKIERLGRFGRWVQDRGMLDLLDRQWAQIEPEADQESKTRFQDLRAHFLLTYEEYRSEHEAQVAAEEAREVLRDERRTLLAELDALSPLDNEAKVTRELERIAVRWQELDSLPAKEQTSFEHKYLAARAQVAGRLEEMGAIVRRNAHLGELLARAEQILAHSNLLNRKQVRKLLDEAKPLLDAKGADEAMAAHFAAVREALDERLRKQKAHAEQRLVQLPDKLNVLTNAIDRGGLKEADPLYRSIVSSIDLIEASGLPHKAYADVQACLRTLAPRLRDLQQWRKWGTDQHRQELCLAMEGLVSEDMHLEAMALRLQDLQSEWKGLDKGGSSVNHPLWKRFHAASERVYMQCKPYLDAQAAEREVNRQQREKLCEELEGFLGQVDWERMDWKKAVRAQVEMRRSWFAMGPVEGRQRRALEKRFRAAMKRLEGHLAEERDRNQVQKRELIARVEALADEPDLGRAIEETKRLQRQWHTTVAARKSEENQLWQRFRAACDVLFARRSEHQEAHAAKLDENLKRREDLCAQAEKLVGSDAAADELTSSLQDLERRWQDTEALSIPRQAASALEKRWRTARGLLESRYRQRLEEQCRRDLDLLADQAARCERLERALETDRVAGLEPAAIEADWQALPKQRDPDLQAAVEQRFGRAVTALAQGGEVLDAFRSAFIAAGERRAELCLHLEILAQIDSPPELTKERLRFQVTRLTEHMRDGEKDPLQATSRLLQEWYLCGPAPARDAASLEERFLRVRRAIEEAERGNEAA